MMIFVCVDLMVRILAYIARCMGYCLFSYVPYLLIVYDCAGSLHMTNLLYTLPFLCFWLMWHGKTGIAELFELGMLFEELNLLCIECM